MMPKIPVSTGELIDKITILEIKNERIEDADKKNNIVKELDCLNKVFSEQKIYFSRA